MTADLEKQLPSSADGPASSAMSTSSSVDTDKDAPQLEAIRTTYTNRSRRSLASQRLDNADVDHIYETLEHCITPDVETEAERMAREPITYTRTGTSVGSTASRPPEFEVCFEENDPEYPRNWPLWYRCWCIFCVSFATWVATLYSTSYTASTPGLIAEFHSSTTVVTLGVTTYLLGLAAGSLVVAPLSELYGRRIVYIVCLVLWAVLIIPCGLVHSLTAIIVVRFIGYVSCSSLYLACPDRTPADSSNRRAFFGAVMVSKCARQCRGRLQPRLPGEKHVSLRHCALQRTRHRPHHRRLRLPVSRVAMDKLDCPHHSQRGHCPHADGQGDVCAPGPGSARRRGCEKRWTTRATGASTISECPPCTC